MFLSDDKTFEVDATRASVFITHTGIPRSRNFSSMCDNLRLVEAVGLVHEIVHCDHATGVVQYRMRYFPRGTLLHAAQAGGLDQTPKLLVQIQQLVKSLTDKHLNHGDVALRNIAIDEDDRLHWIDLDSIGRLRDRDMTDDSMFVGLADDLQRYWRPYEQYKGVLTTLEALLAWQGC